MVYYQSMTATATAGNTVYDAGLRSTTENPKTLLSILAHIKEEPEYTNMFQVWHEQELICEIPGRLFDSAKAIGGQLYSFNRLNEVEIGFAIPIGALVRVASKCVAGTQTILGAYRYEITV